MSKRFHYFHDADGSPIGCLVTSIQRDDNKISYALSVVNKKHDQFNKKFGRHIAASRLDKKPTVIDGPIPERGHDITKVVFSHLLEHYPEPGKNSTFMKVLQCAESWLLDADTPKVVDEAAM